MEPVLLDSDASLEPGPSAPLDIMEHAMRCGDIWAAALKIYFNDAKSAWKGHKQADWESLDDLLGDQRLLANLCRPIDVDPQLVASAMRDELSLLEINSKANYKGREVNI